MKNFSDFTLPPLQEGFVGDKTHMFKILNRKITVLKYKIETSKFIEKGNGKRLCMQIIVGETKHIIFTGSTILQERIQQIQKADFPFNTTIIKDGERYLFT